MMTWHPIALPNPLVSGEKITAKIEDQEILVCRVNERYFPTAGPASRPLATFPVELHEGELYVSLSR